MFNFFIETGYSTFVIFFYGYVLMAVIQFRPFAIGFHPVTDPIALSSWLMGILTLTFLVKSVTELTRWMRSEKKSSYSQRGYILNQRH